MRRSWVTANVETFTQDGVRLTSEAVGRVVVTERVDPPGNRQAPFSPAQPYVAMVLSGAVAKTFSYSAMEIGRRSAVTIPVGARHGARFGADTTRLLVVRWTDGEPAALKCLRHVRDGAVDGLAQRLSAELHMRDTAASLALEALALELLAVLTRGEEPARPAPWLERARALLHDEESVHRTLSGVAAEVGVHPSHLARSFRARYGVTVGGYVRRLRLDRSARRLTAGDEPLAAIAAEAGFADQAHFTRAFRRHTGSTPGRYRALAGS